MNTRKPVLMALTILAVFFSTQAMAGRPVTKEVDGFIEDVDISEHGFVLVKSPEAEYKIPGDKTLTIKKAGKILAPSEVKVGSKVHMNQLKQDGKIVYTLLDIS